MQKLAAILFFLVPVTVFSAEMYKCEVNGTVRFSDVPCVAGQSKITVSPPGEQESQSQDDNQSTAGRNDSSIPDKDKKEKVYQ